MGCGPAADWFPNPCTRQGARRNRAVATASDSTAIPGPPADDPWAAPLAADLADLPPQRRRTLRPLEPCGPAGLRPLAGGASASEPLLDLASNDYLGLACHPQLQQAAGAGAFESA